LIRQNQALQTAADLYEDINAPIRNYTDSMQALNLLLASGRISQEQFTQAAQDARLTFLDFQTDGISGMERAFLRLSIASQDYASQVEDIFTTAFDGIGDAIASMVTEGEFD